ncbi:PREDICTED: peptidyl-prolyl cis-trans isomerase cyp11-like isoform X2 [Populus euphratica]|uniref:Peptidyl-prolyl cis-trans isomerase cyp11-like isoform X2 n=1 Tax=Populus euphratica TaxID=75702 RepID=A0AAJ6UJK7_POPEU|nr:PREDICTED: peptidyl-prolyl cis-trans isomerase cyp11-like isoform X2 [Populus euphratica]
MNPLHTNKIQERLFSFLRNTPSPATTSSFERRRMTNTQNPEVFLDISIGGNLAERIEIELLADHAPKTAQNFLALCSGDMGLGKHTGKPMYLKGSTFYNVVRGKWAEGGDFSEENGTGGENIYGIPFFDEGGRLKHDAPYLLTTASDYHKYTIGSCFFITFNELNELDGKHVVFGRVVRGYETVQKIEQVQTFPDGRPEHLVIITACGVSPKTRSLNSTLIRKDSMLPSEGRHSRKRKSKRHRVVEQHSESRHDQKQKGHSNQSSPSHYQSKSREKTSPGWNYEGDGNSAKESVPRHSRSKLRDKTSQGSRWPSPIKRSDSKHSPRKRHRSNSRDRTGHQWRIRSEISDARNRYTSKCGRSRKNLQKAPGSHAHDRGHSKQQNHCPDPETEFPSLSKSMQMRLRLPGDDAQP